MLFNLLLPILAVVAAPFWLKKAKRRGGLSRRLLEKFANYDCKSPSPWPGAHHPICVHAVSVGEANIAHKLIALWSERYPEQRFLLAVSTTTGFNHAESSPPPQTEVLYAPLDFAPFIKRYLRRYRPNLIVLIEQEVWPNLMHYAGKNGTPVALANARLSQKSGWRLAKLKLLLGPMYRKLSWVGAQTAEDQPRLQAIGIAPETIHATGSIKFDPARETPCSANFDPKPFLTPLGEGPLLMALSTHAGEEVIFARAASEVPDARLVIIPRHMERRAEIVEQLNTAGFTVTLRSTGEIFSPEQTITTILLVDSTGEMPAFTKEADIAFIGKTLTAHGGQNPCEAIGAGVPTIAGPNLENFEPLATELRNGGGITTTRNEEELKKALLELYHDSSKKDSLSKAALKTLESHRGATERSVEALVSLLPKG